MMGLRRWIWMAAVVGLSGAAQAEDVVLKLTRIQNAADCRTMLAEYAWTCDAFDKPHWREFIEAVDGENKTFWEKYSAAFIKTDLDKDGADDLILKVYSVLTCGVRNCDNYFFFSNSTSDTSRREAAISSMGDNIFYRSNDGKHEIRFEEETVWFDIDELKTQTYTSTLFK
jgi:hypothetical protein